MRSKLKGALAILDFAVAPGMSSIHSYSYNNYICSYIIMYPENLNRLLIFSRFLRHCMMFRGEPNILNHIRSIRCQNNHKGDHVN